MIFQPFDNHSSQEIYLKAGLQLLYITPSFTNMEIVDKKFWFQVAKSPILWSKTRIRITSTTVKTFIINMLAFLVDTIFVVFAGKIFQHYSRHTNRHKLASHSRHNAIRTWSGIQTVLVLGWKELLQFGSTTNQSNIDTSMIYGPFIIKTFRIIWVRWISMSFDIKDKTEHRTMGYVCSY